MHRSLMRQVLIDCAPEHFDAMVAFWSGALGGTTEPEDEYVALRGHAAAFTLLLQRLGEGPSRVHLDFEADDQEAEVARLEALGATVVGKVNTWWVMRDPAGLLFCVLRVQSPDFAERARVWD